MPRPSRREALATLHPVRVRGPERRGLFNADTDRDDCVARGATLAVPLGGQPHRILTAAQSGTATAARSCQLLQEPQEP